jgi:hypothetical protein
VEGVPRDDGREAIAIVMPNTIASATTALFNPSRQLTLPENSVTVVAALVIALGMGIGIITVIFVLVGKGYPFLGHCSGSNASDSQTDDM